MVGIIDVEPQLNRESDSSTFNHEVHFFPLASKAGSYNMHGHYKNINVLKPLEAQLLAVPQSGKQIGENGRIFLRPDYLCEILIPTAEESDGSFSLNKCCHLQWDKELLNQPIFEIQADNNFDPVAETTVMYRETMASAFAVLENMRTSRASSPTSNMDPLQISHGIVEADNTSHVSSGESSRRGARENSGSLHEDTQDLEALMSSDEDEMSTGCSPTDGTWNNTSTDMSNGYSIDSSSSTSKRKACDSQWFEEDEVDILGQEVESELKENICPPFCHLSCPNEGNYQTSASMRTCEPVLGRPISNSSAGLHATTARQDILSAKLCQAYASLSGYSAVRKGPRKAKIKMIVKLLRTIIPGGNSMDTADVLGEAIQYVRKLQFKVSKLEASKRTRI
ncbi:hypothetical protein O6H91_19G022700 [Diphasiastrum complanatum]|nr:hypothetical protein O6H91_19G022700 [Diphasiastrum complanatum]